MGGNTCSICNNEAKEAIDQVLVAGTSLRDIAGRTGLSKSSLDRHAQNHLSATLVKAAEDRELAHGVKLLDRVNGLVDKTLASVGRAEAKCDERAVHGGLREARHGLELTVQLDGQPLAGTEVAVVVTGPGGSPILGAEIQVNGEIAGSTDTEGLLTITIPQDDEELEITASVDGRKGELELMIE